MSSRDAEIARVTSQINDLLDDLGDTVAALNNILTSPPAGRNGTTEDAPNERQPG